MHELFAEILGYIQNATRYKWVSMILVWFFCIGGWAFISRMPDQYKAEARVHVDTRSVLRPLLQGITVQPDVSGQIKLMSKLMFSRPNLEKVARMTDLDLGAKDEKSMEKLVARLQASMSISGGDNNLFAIGAEDADPKLAKKIVQSLLTIFVEQTLGETREDSNSAQKFLDQQIKEYEARLQAAEIARETFKREHYGLLPEQGGDLYTALNTLNAQLEDAKMTLQDAVNRRNELDNQLKNEEGSMFSDFIPSGEAEGGAISPIDQRIQGMQEKLDQLLIRFTKNHPEVIAVRKSLAELQSEKKNKHDGVAGSEGSEQPDSTKSSAANASPVFQQMKLALSDADANVAALTSRVKAYEDKIEKMRAQMDERLRVETQLQGLNRDYEAIKSNYDQLLRRRETARLSENVEQNTDSVKFRIVDPPQVPSKPSAPNRILLSSAVLLVSIIFGLALAIFLSLLRPTYNNSQKLRESAGIPVLGSVSMNWIPAIKKQKWREFLYYCGAFGCLMIAFLTVVLLEIKGLNIHRLSL